METSWFDRSSLCFLPLRLVWAYGELTDFAVAQGGG
jgi:hypothetical protein